MKSFYKYFNLFAGLIVSIFTGILSIKVTDNVSTLNKLLKNAGLQSSQLFIMFFIICIVTFLLLIISTITYFYCIKVNLNNHIYYQRIILSLFITIFILVFLMFFILLIQNMDSSLDLSSTEDTNSTSGINLIMITFSIMHLISCIVQTSLIIKYSKKTKITYIDEDCENIEYAQEENRHTFQQKQLSPADQLRKEINEMKQNLEIEQLKEEYAKLYKQINNSKKS